MKHNNGYNIKTNKNLIICYFHVLRTTCKHHATTIGFFQVLTTINQRTLQQFSKWTYITYEKGIMLNNNTTMQLEPTLCTWISLLFALLVLRKYPYFSYYIFYPTYSQSLTIILFSQNDWIFLILKHLLKKIYINHFRF